MVIPITVETQASFLAVSEVKCMSSLNVCARWTPERAPSEPIIKAGNKAQPTDIKDIGGVDILMVIVLLFVGMPKCSFFNFFDKIQ